MKTKTCPDCKGKKEVETAPFFSEEWDIVVCPGCDGRGYVCFHCWEPTDLCLCDLEEVDHSSCSDPDPEQCDLNRSGGHPCDAYCICSCHGSQDKK